MRHCSQTRFVEWPQHIALGIQAFVNSQAQRVTRQQGRTLLMKLIEVGPILTADDQHVGKAGRGQQSSDGAAAFEQGIGSDRHAMNNDERRIEGGGRRSSVWM